jgi:hypothetical protein
MLNDSLNGKPSRIAAGVNLNGVLLGPALSLGIGTGQKSFLMLSDQNRTCFPGPNNVPSWSQWWNTTDALNGQDWRLELRLNGSVEGTFNDLPLLADISGVRKADPSLIDAAVGTINDMRDIDTLTTYLTAFF